MNKKLISMVIVLAMVLTLLPVTVLADDGEKAVVIVYGEALSEAILDNRGSSLDTFKQALTKITTNELSGVPLPEAGLYLVSRDRPGVEYKLEKNAVSNASVFSSFRLSGSNGFWDFMMDVANFIKGAFSWAISFIPTIGQEYAIYGNNHVPQGNYDLVVRTLSGDSYKLREPSSGSCYMNVDCNNFVDDISYGGHQVRIGSIDFKIDLKLFDIDLGSIYLDLPGVFLKNSDPGFSFTSADVGGNKLPGTEFLLVNRDETEKIVKAALKLGKDTFENAMELIGEEGFTWEELNVLNYDLLDIDTEGQQINLDYNEAYRLVATYWGLLAASGSEPLKDFMSNDTDIRLPAILSAKADSNGVVTFDEEDNVTLTWSIKLLLKLAKLTEEQLQDISDEEIMEALGNFNDKPIIKAVLGYVIAETRFLMANGEKIVDENGLVQTVINNFVYAALMNDGMIDFIEDAMGLLPEEWLPEGIGDIFAYLPHHGILTKKMPAGNYIMMETGVPDGYFHNPLFYTMTMTWDTNSENLAEWCHVTVGNVGLIAPYFAEDYYKQLRELNLNVEADKVLALINDNRSKELFGSDTPIQDIIEGDADMTARALQMLISTVYQVTGQTDADQEKAVNSLLPYLQTPGGTVQNMLKLCDKIIKTNKSVITDEITTDWKFYTPTTSIRTNAALRFKAFMQELSKAIVTDDKTITGKVNTAVKDTIDKIVNSVDTKNYTEPYVTAAKKAVKDKVSGILSNVLQKAVATVKNTIKTIAGGGKLPIIKW